MIQIENITKSFGDRILFKDFSVQIDKGEFVIFSGVSGCGKTTLLNIIGTLENVDAGKVIVDGIDILNKRNQQKYFQHTVGFLFQNFILIEDKTVRENLKLIKENSRSGISMEDALNRVGLSDRLDHKVYTLSGGEQQRLALARLMIKKCDVILADEPTGSLDKKNAEIVMDILLSLHKEGKTVILVTHDDTLKDRCGRVIEL